MKKILIINTVRFGMGGISSVIINYIKNMNKDGMEITVIVNSKIEKSYEDILKENGIKIIVLKRNYNIINYIYNMHKIIRNYKFDTIHIHGNSSTMAIESIIAYLNNIPKRIVHCHNVTCNHKILNKILWPFLKRTYTLGVACSKEAGKWLFKNEEFIVLKNAIDLEKYKFNEEVRSKVREELKIKDSYLIGHIGYFNEQKNHEKLFEVISFLKDKIDVKLLCISGDKNIPHNIQEMIKKYKLENNIDILLRRNDVNRLLQAIDFFVFPSKFEGLGVALIEAQAAGVSCLISNYVPKSAVICDEIVASLDLSKESYEWAKLILDIKNETSNIRSKIDVIDKLKKAGYCIKSEAEKLRYIYMDK